MNEFLWRNASRDLPLYRYDAVQTLPGATARLELFNGSFLELRPNTIVIVHSDLLSKRHQDRAALHNGRLTGGTEGELWLLTSAALFRLRGKEKQGAAKAEVFVVKAESSHERKLSVHLSQGEGSLVKRSALSPTRTPTAQMAQIIPVIPRQPIVVVASEAESSSRDEWSEPEIQQSDKVLASYDEAVAKEGLALNTPTAVPTEKPVPRKIASRLPVELSIHSPANQSEVAGETVEFHGSLTGPGAKLFINGREVPVDSRNRFSTRVGLRVGVNTIVVHLVRDQNDSVFRRWIVMRKK